MPVRSAIFSGVTAGVSCAWSICTRRYHERDAAVALAGECEHAMLRDDARRIHRRRDIRRLLAWDVAELQRHARDDIIARHPVACETLVERSAVQLAPRVACVEPDRDRICIMHVARLTSHTEWKARGQRREDRWRWRPKLCPDDGAGVFTHVARP